MLGVFFVSSHILPYVPTILASALILNIGIELMIEALWESSSSLVWHEWVTVAGTTLACSFIGFAPGIGIGLVIIVSLYFVREAFHTVRWRDIDCHTR
jgi:MFS superfamily sulfate permease-like transporter